MREQEQTDYNRIVPDNKKAIDLISVTEPRPTRAISQMPNELLLQPTLLAILLILFFWLLGITILFVRSESRFRSLLGSGEKRDIRSILEQLKKDNQLVNEEVANLQKLLSELEISLTPHIQKVGFIRYNPFSDTGGDQSFCLCLLDRHDNGVVVSSLHSRDQTRIYAKKISRGKSPGYTLSKEERAVITRATA